MANTKTRGGAYKGLSSKLGNVGRFVRISSDEKEELIGTPIVKQKGGLSKFTLLSAFLMLFLILSVFLPKIYVSNNIYYISRDIAKLQAEKELLNEERQRLSHNIELIRNKHLLMELGY